VNQILRLTYRRNFPNNTVKIWDLVIPRGKLFAFRDLWETDGESTGKREIKKTKISRFIASCQKDCGADLSQKNAQKCRCKGQAVIVQKQKAGKKACFKKHPRPESSRAQTGRENRGGIREADRKGS